MTSFSTPMATSQVYKDSRSIKDVKKVERKKREKRNTWISFTLAIILKRGIYYRKVPWFWESIFEEINKKEARNARDELQREKGSTSSI